MIDMNQSDKQKNLAVLIDADNAQPGIIEDLLSEIAKFGISTVKRIYGDWTSPHLKSWKSLLLEYAIHPIQQFRYTTGKNATDSAMIIDAMDLLYTNRFDGFCIVSSDSDFTRLASRIREAGLMVYGFGKKGTPRPFVNACNKFIFTEILRKEDPVDIPIVLSSEQIGGSTEQAGDAVTENTELSGLLQRAVEASEDESGWALLSRVGVYLSNHSPEFDPRNYGYKKLGKLVKILPYVEVKERKSGKSLAKVIYVRNKRT
jgi:hypothetical protein